MRKTLFIFSLMAITVLASCSREVVEDGSLQDVQEVCVIAPDDIIFEDISTRGTEIAPSGALRFSWVIGDTLGIFPNQGNQVEFPITSTEGGASAVFDGGSWGLKSNASYAAYYPFSVWNYHRDNKTIIVDYAGQVQDGNGSFSHLSAYDYLASSRVTAVDGRVSFQMDRLGSILYIDIAVPGPCVVNSLELSCEESIFVERAALDLSGSEASLTPTKMTNSLTLEFENVVTTSPDENVRAYMAVSPVNFSDKIVNATLYTDKGRLSAPVVSREVSKGKAAILRFSEDFAPIAIQFADPEVERLCVANWDTDGDGKLSIDEAEAVTEIVGVFDHNETLTSFEELSYFTGLTKISQGAFYGCHDLQKVILPENVVVIENEAFWGCGFSNISIPGSVISIGDRAFGNCQNMNELLLPEGVQRLGVASFSRCNNLTSVTLPESLVSIGLSCFSSCNSLLSFNGKFTAEDHRSLIIDGSLVGVALAGITEYEIPSGVTSISDYAFNGCSNIVSIDIPESVTSVGKGAFWGCSSLASLTIPAGVTAIEDRTFNECSSLTSIDLPDGITSVGAWAFYKCESLTEILLPDSVTSIGAGAFFNCDGLTAITLPEGLTTIEKEAFQMSEGLTAITIPSSVTSIGDYAFQSCTSLTSITVLAATPPVIGSGVFSNIGSPYTIKVPSGKVTTYKKAENWSDYSANIK